MLFALCWACSWLGPSRGVDNSTTHAGLSADGQAITDDAASLVVVAMGDLMIHQAVDEAAWDFASARQSGPRSGYDAVFEGIRPLVRDADIAFANLETPVAPSRFRPRRPRVFNADPLVVESLVETGFDLVSLANNHIFDQGPEGLDETMAVLSDRGLGYLGVGSTCEEARTPAIVRRNGLEVAFLAATELLNENWNVHTDATCVATIDPAEIIARAQAAREAGADFVVLSLHWGDEYEPKPGAERRILARRLVEGGVDVIIGHHAHVLQPVELHRTSDGRLALVAYGLGNLVSNQSAWYDPGRHEPDHGRTRDGLALSFRLTRRQAGSGLEAVEHREVVDVHPVPLWTVNNRLDRTEDSGTEIRVLPTRDAVNELLQADPASGDDASREAWVAELERRRAEVLEWVRPEVIYPSP